MHEVPALKKIFHYYCPMKFYTYEEKVLGPGYYLLLYDTVKIHNLHLQLYLSSKHTQLTQLLNLFE